MFVVPTTKQRHNHMGEHKPGANGSTILRCFLGFPKPCWFDQCYFFPFFRMCFFDTSRRYHHWRESILKFTWFWWSAWIAETFQKKTCSKLWSWQDLFGWLILIKVRKSNFLVVLSSIKYLLRYWPIWNAFLSLSKMDHPSTPCGTYWGFILCEPFFQHFILFASGAKSTTKEMDFPLSRASVTSSSTETVQDWWPAFKV